MPKVESMEINDYLDMIRSVAYKNLEKFVRYNWNKDELISELWIAGKRSLETLAKKPADEITNVAGWVMTTLHNRINRLLNLETMRINSHLYVKVVRKEEVGEFQVVFLDHALKMAADMLVDIEKDVLMCLINPPATLQALMSSRSTKDRADKSLSTIADYLGISYSKFMDIVKKIRNIVESHMSYEYVTVERGVREYA